MTTADPVAVQCGTAHMGPFFKSSQGCIHCSHCGMHVSSGSTACGTNVFLQYR